MILGPDAFGFCGGNLAATFVFLVFQSADHYTFLKQFFSERRTSTTVKSNSTIIDERFFIRCSAGFVPQQQSTGDGAGDAVGPETLGPGPQACTHTRAAQGDDPSLYFGRGIAFTPQRGG